MMKKQLAALCISAISGIGFAVAGDFDKEIETRQSYMKMLGFNVSILANMTRGKTEYDADQASAAANNLMHLSMLNNSALWPMGSDMGSNDNTVAKAELWANFPDAGAILQDMASATKTLSAEAGNGLEALKANFGPVGQACSACHKQFRAKR